MSKLMFAEKAWEDYLYWQTNDRKTLKRINLLLQDISRNGNDGIGKPEPLKRRDDWSSRIDEVNRLVYRLIMSPARLKKPRRGGGSGGPAL
ncbi:MAG: Txe/YoeB family addiction module toxin [Oscillospiraceae bacterium]|jgi:toxin YoeB|nr:Txe/YoeB family addiction module toxin [Oscillospiraceae bacterium]